MSTYHLAQMNIARMHAPLTDPVMAGFVAQLDAMNALADRTPGFIWRLEEHLLPGTDETSRAYAAESILVNLSVWEGVEPLQHYVYHSAHGGLLRNRRDWFEKMEERWVVLWWVPAGLRPSVAEGPGTPRTPPRPRPDRPRVQLQANFSPAAAVNFRADFP